jgi:hypothetical protein
MKGAGEQSPRNIPDGRELVGRGVSIGTKAEKRLCLADGLALLTEFCRPVILQGSGGSEDITNRW